MENLKDLARWKTIVEPSGLSRSYEAMNNLSYINSAVQALFAVPMFAQHLRASTHTTLGCPSARSCPFHLMEAASKAVLKAPSRERPLTGLGGLVTHLQQIHGEWSPFSPHDAREFVLHLLNRLDDIYLRDAKVRPAELPDKVAHTTPFGHIFGGWHRELVACPSCPYQTVAHSFAWDMSLPVKGQQSVQQAIATALADDGVAGWTCDGCGEAGHGARSRAIASPPRTLLLTLQVFDAARGRKVTRTPAVPEVLDLTPHLVAPHDDVRDRYSLTAVIRHRGGSTPVTGEYYVTARVGSGKWLMVADATVQSIGLDAVLTGPGRSDDTPYLLIYTQQQPETLTVPKRAPTQTVIVEKRSGFAAKVSRRASAEEPVEPEPETEPEQSADPADTADSDSDSESDVDMGERFKVPQSVATITGAKAPEMPAEWVKDEYNKEFDLPKQRKVRSHMLNALQYPKAGDGPDRSFLEIQRGRARGDTRGRGRGRGRGGFVGRGRGGGGFVGRGRGRGGGGFVGRGRGRGGDRWRGVKRTDTRPRPPSFDRVM